MALRCDVSDEDAVAAVVHQTISTLGQLDFAFNNAGIQFRLWKRLMPLVSTSTD